MSVGTQPFPGSPPDLQAQFVDADVHGQRDSSEVRETIFENCFTHVQVAGRAGVKIDLKVDPASLPASVACAGAGHGEDLRASASRSSRPCRAR